MVFLYDKMVCMINVTLVWVSETSVLTISF